MDNNNNSPEKKQDAPQKTQTMSEAEKTRSPDKSGPQKTDSPQTTMVKEVPEINEVSTGTQTSEMGDMTLYPEQMIPGSPEDSRDRTKVHFDGKGLTQELQKDLDEVPNVAREDLTSNELSVLLKDVFPEKTEAEKIRINRRFLGDAEPFDINRLKNDLTKESRGLVTGLLSLDDHLHISSNTLTIITSMANHGKTIFMQNLMLSMARMYPDLHFVYYSYEEPRHEVEAKLINISGDTCFNNDTEKTVTNLEKWKYELRTKDIEKIKELGETKPEYRGTVNFLGLARRIHVVDSFYNIKDLGDSIKSFCNTFVIGAIFIDPVQRIPLAQTEKKFLQEWSERKEIVEKLSYTSRQLGVAILLSSRFPTKGEVLSEYDLLCDWPQSRSDGINQEAGLTIALQNYAKSNYLGSDSGRIFFSKFFDEPIRTKTPTPDYFKTNQPETIMLAKILANRTGPEFETELLFNRWLMKISDLTPDGIDNIKGYAK